MRKLSGPAVMLVAIAALAGAPRAASAQDARAEVLATIDRFLEGLRTKDTTMMRAQVDTLTRFTLLRPSPAGGVQVVAITASQFINFVSQPNQPGIDEPIRNPVVQIDGDLATVWAEYQVRSNGTVTHCGHDAFHLARLDGRWKILHVSDTFRQTGCGGPW